MRRRRVRLVSVVVGIGALFLVGANAWACTEFTSLQAPKSGTPLAEVDVKGTGRVAPRDADKQVEIRWNDVSGPIVAKGTAGEISSGVKATIPDVEPGIYFLLAVVDGKGIARTSIEVTSATGQPGPLVDRRPAIALATPSSSSNGASPQFLGFALLAGGLVVLLGGVVVGLTRPRRRAVVERIASDIDSNE